MNSARRRMGGDYAGTGKRTHYPISIPGGVYKIYESYDSSQISNREKVRRGRGRERGRTEGWPWSVKVAAAGALAPTHSRAPAKSEIKPRLFPQNTKITIIPLIPVGTEVAASRTARLTPVSPVSQAKKSHPSSRSFRLHRISARQDDATGSFCHRNQGNHTMDSLAPARSALAGLWLRAMELPLLPSVSHDRDCRCRDLQTFLRFASGSSHKICSVINRTIGTHRRDACATTTRPGTLTSIVP